MAIIGNQILSTNYLSDQFSGDGSTVAFTLSLAPASAASISVYVSGLYQIPGSAYTVSGSTLTFTGAPPTGTNNIYVLYLGVKNQNLVPVNGSITPQMLNNANVVYWGTGNNNVGIGTTTPAATLNIADATSGDGTVRFGNNATYYGYIQKAYAADKFIIGTAGGAQALTFENGGSEVLRAAANGDIGIGNSSPTARLHVFRSSTAAAPIGYFQQASGSPGAAPVLKVQRLDNLQATIYANNAGLYIKDHSSNFPLHIEDHSANPLFTVKGGGTVALGTTQPDIYGFGGKILAVQGGSSYTNLILAGDNNSGIALGTSTGRLGQITMDGTYGMTFYSQGTGGGLSLTLNRSGNVGVGNNISPSAKLEVVGGGIRNVYSKSLTGLFASNLNITLDDTSIGQEWFLFDKAMGDDVKCKILLGSYTYFSGVIQYTIENNSQAEVATGQFTFHVRETTVTTTNSGTGSGSLSIGYDTSSGTYPDGYFSFKFNAVNGDSHFTIMNRLGYIARVFLKVSIHNIG